MMIALHIILITLGLYLFIQSEANLNRMSKKTCLRVRIAFWMVAVSAAALVLWPFVGAPLWWLICSVVLLMGGGVLLSQVNVRKDHIFGCRHE